MHLGRHRLHELGVFNNTDKTDNNHSFCGRIYLSIYEQYVRDRRWSKTNVLEIGVLSGASLRTWRDYFPHGKIFGIDIDPATAKHSGERIAVAIGSQGDESFLSSVFSGTEFDVIVDDGSHVNELTTASFKSLMPRLKKAGIYIIEDLRCSYDRLQTDHDIRSWWPGMHYNSPDTVLDNDRKLMNDFFAEIIQLLDHQCRDVEFVHFWSQTCVIGKASSKAIPG